MCDHQFISSDYTVRHGKFYSPRYPSSYPKNIRCSYRFKGRLKERIRIIFEEVTLQKGDLSAFKCCTTGTSAAETIRSSVHLVCFIWPFVSVAGTYAMLNCPPPSVLVSLSSSPCSALHAAPLSMVGVA
ncbi:Sol1 [Carabus blaptoides fortunei]